MRHPLEGPVPIAAEGDAATTGRLPRGFGAEDVVAVPVTENPDGGSIDVAGVEQRQPATEKAFAVLRAVIGADVETELRYGADLATEFCAAAADHGAIAIIPPSHHGSRWVRLLSGVVESNLITDTDRPAVVLPDVVTGD